MNNLLRMLNNKKLSDRYSIQELHELSGLLSINQMTGQMILMEAWKLLQKSFDFFKRVTNNSNMTMRSESRGDLETSKTKKEARCQFYHQACLLWNVAPTKLRETTKYLEARKIILEFAKNLPI